MQFLTYSVGLNAFPKNAAGVLAQPRMTKVQVSRGRNPTDPTDPANAFKLQAVSGHNLSNKPGFHTMSEEDYQNLPTDSVERARAMLALCGYEA